MAKKQLFLALFTILLVGVYVIFFTNWLKPRVLHVAHVARPRTSAQIGARVAEGNQNTDIILFSLDHQCRLTEIKVVQLSEWQTNRLAQPLWHLISDSNSVPIKMFPYGLAIRGMKPAAAGAWPKPLEPNIVYRLFVSAGSLKGEHDFTPPPKPATGR